MKKSDHSPARLLFLIAVFMMMPAAYVRGQDITPDILTLKEVRRDLDFITYCEGRQNYSDAIFLLKKAIQKPGLPASLVDTINYKMGWNYYSLKVLDTSATCFLHVSRNSDFYYKSRFFGAYNLLFLGKHSQAKEVFLSTAFDDNTPDSLKPVLQQLFALELGGTSLLERDFTEFDKHSSIFDYQYYPLSTEQHNLLIYNDLLRRFTPRSPCLAGLMSAIIPGSGKIYAGKTGEGIAAFLIITSLGLIGYENYHKDGWANWKTLLAGGIFSVYYTGNILGSVKAANRYNHDYTQALDKRILFDLHIPLRNIFN